MARPRADHQQAGVVAVVSLDVDGIITNVPEVFEAVLGSRALAGTKGPQIAAEQSRACRSATR